jgi:predicted transcriptional regulator
MATVSLDIDSDEGYKDESVLRELYIEEDMTQNEINEFFDTTSAQYWINKFGIEKDDPYSSEPRIPENELQYMYWDRGMSQSEIAEEFDCTQSLVHILMDECGMDTRDFEEIPEPPTSEKRLEEMYIEKGMGTRTISGELDCSRNRVSYWVDRFGIEKHNSGNREITEKVVDDIIDMYKSGMTQKEISDNLEVDQTTVSYWLGEEDVEIRNKAGFGSVNMTERGEEVKSTYEKEVADKLYNNEVNYQYEKKLSEIDYIPDFVVNGDIVEVWGIKNDKRYDSRRKDKVSTYQDLGYNVFSVFPGTIEEDVDKVINNV